MQRRNARLKREFLLRKQLNTKGLASYQQKSLLAGAMAGDGVLPNEIRGSALRLFEGMEYDDAYTGKKGMDDDEYSRPVPPKILLTTSRDPSSRLKQFAKELRFLFPNTQRVNRGTHVVSELVQVARTNGFTDLIILHETRGEPDEMVVSHLPYGPTAYFGLNGTVLRAEVEGAEHAPEKAPNVVLEGLKTKVGARLGCVLQHLFPTAKPESNRVVSFVNRQDCIVFRHHVFRRVGNEVVMKEAGPRFNLVPYALKLDTVDSKTGEYEWRLSSFTNTGHKRSYL